jgi:hypothetical protein
MEICIILKNPSTSAAPEPAKSLGQMVSKLPLNQLYQDSYCPADTAITPLTNSEKHPLVLCSFHDAFSPA